MGRIITLFLLAMPLIEIALFVVIGRAIGVLPTILGVVLSAMLGGLVIRWQGFAVLSELRASVSQAALPARRVGDAMLIGLAGLLLIIPGYLSDLFAVLLLLPPVRGLIYKLLAKRFTVVTATPDRPAAPGQIDLDDDSWRER